jgi:glutamine amidotransferase
VTTIIDYGIGNIGSIANMLKKIGEEAVITAERQKIKEARRLILCGIGAFDDGLSKLEALGIIDVLKEKVLQDKTPILGICLGMQLFTNKSEEGNKPGLGFIDAETVKFNFTAVPDRSSLRIPHIGWNDVVLSKPSPLFENMHDAPRYYFVHSYFVKLQNLQDELLCTTYGSAFTSAFEKGNVIGVQFHPEKSHKFGIKLFENFVRNY